MIGPHQIGRTRIVDAQRQDHRRRLRALIRHFETNAEQINLDAERLGAEVNAYTDKDHTAFQMRGLARDAAAFVRMLGDIMRESTFPEAELERERGVLLHEYAEDEDDAMAAAFKLFDNACYGAHPAARPVIGNRANIRRFARDDLVAWARRQYTGANIVVGVAGNVEPDEILVAAQCTFALMQGGRENVIAAPGYVGDIRSRRLPRSSQVHVVVGFPIPSLPGEHVAYVLAAALLGEGMSSPLLDCVRERRGLVYHADCWTGVKDAYGQFVIEAATTPEQFHEYVSEVARLLHQHAETTDLSGLERARNQTMVRILGEREAPARRLELAALDLFALGRVRSRAEIAARLDAVGPLEVRQRLAGMLAERPAVAIAGKLKKVPAGAGAGSFAQHDAFVCVQRRQAAGVQEEHVLVRLERSPGAPAPMRPAIDLAGVDRVEQECPRCGPAAAPPRPSPRWAPSTWAASSRRCAARASRGTWMPDARAGRITACASGVHQRLLVGARSRLTPMPDERNA